MTRPATFITLAAPARTLHCCATWPGTSTPKFFGFALVIACRDEHGTWSIRIEEAVIGPELTKEQALERLADKLPIAPVFIGWELGRMTVEPLLDLARDLDEPMRYHLTARLARAMRGLVVDMAHNQGDTAPVARGSGFQPIRSVPAELVSCQRHRDLTSGVKLKVRRALRDDTLAIWRYWLRSAPAGAEGALAATQALMSGDAI